MKYPDQESMTLEFKAAIPKHDQIIKTAIGFCNQHGGRLLLGVADDGTLIGVDEEEAFAMMEYLEHAIFQATTPPIIPNVYLQRLMDKILVVVEVSAGMNKPYYRHSEGLEKGTYIRLGRSTIRASAEMIKELQWQARGITYEQLPLYQASIEELDNNLIKQFLSNRRQTQNAILSNEVLENYHLITTEHTKQYPTVAGTLLFGKRVQYWLPETMIICSHFKGVNGREALAAIDCTGTLFNQFDQAMNFVLSRLTHSFKIKKIRREEKLEIPAIALRELILNAIVHRNYHLRAPTKIAIYDDRIEIFSPGNFPTPFPNLRLGLTDARNMIISKVFREAGLVEKLGTGFNTVFDSYQEWGLPNPIIEDGNGFVKCILPRANYRAINPSDLLENKILQLFSGTTELSVSDVMNALQSPRSTTSRKLKELVEQDKLHILGTGKGTRYKRN